MRWVWVGVCALLLGSLLLFKPAITGYTFSSPANPGTITVVNFEAQPLLWGGLVGDMVGSTTDVTMNAGQIQNISLPGNCEAQFLNTVLFSPASDIVLRELNNATPAIVDAYLGVTPGQTHSGNHTFNETRNFTVWDRVYSTSSARSPTNHSQFHMGLFTNNDSDVVIAASIFPNATNYENTRSDFQVILPLINGSATNYYVYVDNSACPIPVVEEDEPSQPRQNTYIRSYNRTTDEGDPIEVIFSEDEPELPDIEPGDVLPKQPLQVNAVASIIDGGYAIDVTLIGLDEEIFIEDVDLRGDVDEYFIVADPFLIFLPGEATQIVIEALGEVPSGKYSGEIILYHEEHGEIIIPFEIGVPEQAAFNFAPYIVLILALVALLLTGLLIRMELKHRKKH